MLKGIEPAGYRKIACGNTLFIKHLHLGAEDWEPVFTADQLREAVLREREACAALCESRVDPEWPGDDVSRACDGCADAIRERE